MELNKFDRSINDSNNDVTDDLLKRILLHLLIFGPDTPKLMRKRLLGERTNIGPPDIKEACIKLREMGLVKRRDGKTLPKHTPTSSIKPWIKIKARSKETAKHGQYFELTKEGKKIAKEIRNKYEQYERE
ncbi:MAG: DUF2250 domain-containing protein [Archaeoglobus sp.]|nr:DUF2250 domain-containing protein [Archaeoglobus sp.]